jgi:hypothetical protein
MELNVCVQRHTVTAPDTVAVVVAAAACARQQMHATQERLPPLKPRQPGQTLDSKR